MGLIDIASAKSLFRGLDYYKREKVMTWERSGEFSYDGSVSGSNGEQYPVHVDLKHPKKSTCKCAFADGRRVICKHMIALYFTAEPKAADDFIRQVEMWEEEEQEAQDRHYDEVVEYVHSLSVLELRMQLIEALMELEERNGGIKKY